MPPQWRDTPSVQMMILACSVLATPAAGHANVKAGFPAFGLQLSIFFTKSRCTGDSAQEGFRPNWSRRRD